eukprot:TRINITY_DN27454_c0_g1_i1.p1 TRINITY_DN27454_c0_g1~~TRINITY_DN27454_c0_g1_i1.p1  ORF type:complete len:666 (-),score=133.19 TRINITY_DN27454_c0_g1_i1:476-2473(-)
MTDPSRAQQGTLPVIHVGRDLAATVFNGSIKRLRALVDEVVKSGVLSEPGLSSASTDAGKQAVSSQSTSSPVLKEYVRKLAFSAAQREPRLGDGAEVCRIIVETLGAPFDEPGRLLQTPLFFAASKGAEEVAKYLIDVKAAADRIDQNADSPLCYAARYGRVGCIKLLLAAKALPGRYGCKQQTPMHYAALHGHSEAVEVLLEAKARIDARDALQRTPLHLAKGPGEEAGCTSVLLRAGLKYGLLDERDVYKQTALFDSARRGDVAKANLLLQARAMVDTKDLHRQTPLFLAAANGHLSLCKVLVNGRANIRARNLEKRSLVDIAKAEKRDEVAAYLDGLMSADCGSSSGSAGGSARRKSSSSASGTIGQRKRMRTSGAVGIGLQGAISKASTIPKRSDKQRKALNGGCIDSESLFGNLQIGTLPFAVLNSSVAEVRSLVLAGQDPKMCSEEGLLNLLFQAASRRPGEDDAATEMCRFLVVDCGVNPAFVDSQLRTPLFYAAKHGHAGCLSYLLSANCCVDHRDELGQTALWWAARLEKSDCAKALLDNSADAGREDQQGRTPLDEVKARGREGGELWNLLLSRGSRLGTGSAAVLSAQLLAEADAVRQSSEEQNKKLYRIDFKAEDGGTVPYQSKEYKELLKQLCEACPLLTPDVWVKNSAIAQ